MNQPTDKKNYLIEVTPEQLNELSKIYQYVDEEGYVDMHYSPHWKKINAQFNPTEAGEK